MHVDVDEEADAYVYVERLLTNVSAKVKVFGFKATLESPLLLNVSAKINAFESIATFQNQFLRNVSAKVKISPLVG